MKITWTNNVAKVGGVKFEIIEWVDMTQGTLFDLDVYIGSGRMTPVTQTTEAMAHTVAEEIAEAIFKGEEEFRLYEKHADGSTTLENIYYTQEEAEQMALDDPEGYVVQRGLFVPLEQQGE